MIEIVKTEITSSDIQIKLSNGVEIELIIYQDNKIWVNFSFADVVDTQQISLNQAITKYKKREYGNSI